MTLLVKRKKDMKEYNKKNGEPCDSRAIVFLYKFVPGAADTSFGVGVAEMAGLPQTLLEKAEYKAKQFNTNCTASFK